LKRDTTKVLSEMKN